jgi:hypothetical protein
VGKALASDPMLMLLAGADEQNEPAPCVRLAAWLKEKGIPIRVVTYPGAHHGFDRLRPVAFDRNYVGSVRPSTIWIRFHLTQAALIVVGLMGSASATTLAGAFNAEMRTWMGAHGVARSSLAVMRDGRLVHVAGFGDRGASERVGVWSLSKAINGDLRCDTCPR